MAAKLLILGIASDGPSNVAIRPQSERELRNLFGGAFSERIFVSPVSSSLSLQFEPFSFPINRVEGYTNYLYSPWLSGSVLSFGVPGLKEIPSTQLVYTVDRSSSMYDYNVPGGYSRAEAASGAVVAANLALSGLTSVNNMVGLAVFQSGGLEVKSILPNNFTAVSSAMGHLPNAPGPANTNIQAGVEVASGMILTQATLDIDYIRKAIVIISDGGASPSGYSGIDQATQLKQEHPDWKIYAFDVSGVSNSNMYQLGSVIGDGYWIYSDQNTFVSDLIATVIPENNVQVDLSYTPYLGKSDLLYSARKHFQITGQMPYVMRVGGAKASLVQDGWEFEAKFAGKKYNNLVVAFGSGSVSISGMEPNYTSYTYTSSDPKEIFTLMDRDFSLGVLPVQCVSTSAMIFGSYTLSGGVDGSLDDIDLDYVISNSDFPIEASHVLVLNTLSSAMVESISTYNSSSHHQPRLYIIPAPEFSGTVEAWASGLVSELPYRSNMISSVVGNITSRLDTQEKERYAAEAAAIAFIRAEGYNLTNLPINAIRFSPLFSEYELNYLKSAGFVTITRHILNDISVYEGTTTYAENSFLYSSKVAEICAVSYDYCYQFMGRIIPDGERRDLSDSLASLLRRINYITIQLVRVVVRGDSMYVTVDAILPHEILSISFQVKNR